MNVTYEQIEKANESIKPILLKHKDKKTGEIKVNKYSEVNQRIKAFRMVYPCGAIITEMVSNEGGVCVFRATIYDEEQRMLATGTAFEKEEASYINQTSYIENCETSAVGRALGMCGFGIDTSVASADEVQNAIKNQGKDEEPKVVPKATPKQIEVLNKAYTGANLTKLLEANGISSLEEMSLVKASELIGKLKAKEKTNG